MRIRFWKRTPIARATTERFELAKNEQERLQERTEEALERWARLAEEELRGS